MASEDDDDFNNTTEDQGQRLVGRGLTGRETNPEDPQWFLANSGKFLQRQIEYLAKLVW